MLRDVLHQIEQRDRFVLTSHARPDGDAIGSALAAYAGIMNGLYYNEINFGMGLYLGVIGFAASTPA